MSNQDIIINEIINQLTITFGVGGFIAIVLIGFIIWFFINQQVNRIEQTFASELQKNREKELDLIYRRREVYGRLIKSMRVFLQKGDPTEKSTEEEKNEFLAAYDEMYIWAPDEVLKSVNDIVKLKRIWAAKKVEAQEANKELGKSDIAALQIKYKELHKICLQKIRKDCGFAETEFDYSYVSF